MKRYIEITMYQNIKKKKIFGSKVTLGKRFTAFIKY